MTQVIPSDLKSFYLERSEERAIFRGLVAAPLNPSRQHVFLIEGTGGAGKTWLLHDLLGLCQEENLASHWAFIDCYDTEHLAVEGFIRAIVHQLDQAHFPKTQDRLARIEQTQRPEERHAWYDQLQTSFAHELAKFVEVNHHRTVFFVDTFELVQEGEVGGWLSRNLLPALRSLPILIVIAGRRLAAYGQELARQPYVHTHRLANFTVDQIEKYLEHYLGAGPRDDDLHWLATRIHTLANGGEPLWIVALDGSNLLWLSEAGVSLDLARDLQKPEVMGRLRVFLKGTPQQYRERLVRNLFHSLPPDSRWLLLYAARLHRRFGPDVVRALTGTAFDMASLANLSFVKYRESASGEITCLPHDLIREEINRLFWRGSISKEDLRTGLDCGVLGSDRHLAALAREALLSTKATEVRGEPLCRLREQVDWLAVLRYYTPAIGACRNRTRRQVLQAEQFCYELRRDRENAWLRWRKTYYEAFEAYQRGFCGQLELAALSAWEDDELAADTHKREIVEMVRLRRWWWAIQQGEAERRRAISALQNTLAEPFPDPAEGWHELGAHIHATLGWAFALEGEFRKSLHHRVQAAANFRALNQGWDLAFVLDFLGESYERLGNHREADRAWDEAMQIAHQFQDRYRIASVAMKWSTSWSQRGDLDEALDYAHLAVSLFRELGDDRSLGLGLDALAQTYLARGGYQQAQRALEEFQTLCERVGGNEDRIRLQLSWGRFYRRRTSSHQYGHKDDVARARQKLEAAQQLAEKAGLDSWRTNVEEELDTLHRGEA